MQKKLFTVALTTVFAFTTILAGCGSPKAAEPTQEKAQTAEKTVELNLGHVYVTESHGHAMATKFAELASKNSNGSIKISVFPQSQLGGDVKMIQSMRTGTQSLAITNQPTLVNTIPEYSIFDLPYLFESSDQANKVLAGPVGQKYLDMLDKHGLIGLGWINVMENNVFSNKPIQSSSDMKSMKIRVLQAPGYVKAYEALGAQPTPMAYSELYLSLQQGAVDGAHTPPDQFIKDKFFEVSKYYNLTKTHYLPLVLAMSKGQWEKLSPNQQKVLKEAAKEACQFDIEFYKKEYIDSLEKIKKAGVKVVDTNIASFKGETDKAYDAILKDIPNGIKLLEEIQAAKK